jgi:putative resolvase
MHNAWESPTITAWRWFKAGQIKGYQAKTGTIIGPARHAVTELLPERAEPSLVNAKVAVYARVSAAENKANLDGQAQGQSWPRMAKRI